MHYQIMRRLLAALAILVACEPSETPADRLADACQEMASCIEENWDPERPSWARDQCGGYDSPLYQYAQTYSMGADNPAAEDVAAVVCGEEPGPVLDCADKADCAAECYASVPWQEKTTCIRECTDGDDRAEDAAGWLAWTTAGECYAGGMCEEFRAVCG